MFSSFTNISASIPSLNDMRGSVETACQYPITRVSSAIAWLDRHVVALSKQLPNALALIALASFRSAPFIAAKALLPLPMYVTVMVAIVAYRVFTKAKDADLIYPLYGMSFGCFGSATKNIFDITTSISHGALFASTLATCELINNLVFASLSFFFAHSTEMEKVTPSEKPPSTTESL